MDGKGHWDRGHPPIQFDPENQPQASWTHNVEVVQVFGPFVNAAGGGDVEQGHEVYIMIMKDTHGQ
jgi:hypothetical protein